MAGGNGGGLGVVNCCSILFWRTLLGFVFAVFGFRILAFPPSSQYLPSGSESQLMKHFSLKRVLDNETSFQQLQQVTEFPKRNSALGRSSKPCLRPRSWREIRSCVGRVPGVRAGQRRCACREDKRGGQGPCASPELAL